MNKWKITLYLAALFLAGVVTGSVVTVTVGRQMMSPEKMTYRWRHDLEVKLQLTSEQAQKIDPILKDAMATFGDRLADQMLASMSECNAKIRTVLAPEQQAKFDEIEQQQIQFVNKFKTRTNSNEK